VKPTSETNDAVVRRSNEIYDAAAARHGAAGAAVLLTRQARQYHRFAELLRHVDLEDPATRLLDVGCGNAELYKYLAGRGYRGRYAGLDVSEGVLAQARARFPRADLRRVDLMAEDVGERFDYVVMSGLFNADAGQPLAWVQQFLRRMFALADVALVFNALSTYVSFRDPGLAYLDPAQMLAFCVEQLSRRVTLAHHNLSYNYTVAVFAAQDAGLACEE
jgi:SAM-dependent methyltransferase